MNRFWAQFFLLSAAFLECNSAFIAPFSIKRNLKVATPTFSSNDGDIVIGRRAALKTLPTAALTSQIAIVAMPNRVEALSEDNDSLPFRVAFEVQLDEFSSGQIVVEVVPQWAPAAAGRFRELVERDYFRETRFFRVLPFFIAQFGINGDPDINKEWLCSTCKRLPDEPRRVSNNKGTLTFASGGKDSRQTQVFINLNDNGGIPNFLDSQGFVPFARVVEGMEVAERLYSGYGLLESASGGLAGGVNQAKAVYYGNKYLAEMFPKLSYIKSSKIL